MFGDDDGSSRIGGFKKGSSTNDARRKREDRAIQLRRNRRTDNLRKRRSKRGQQSPDSGFFSSPSSSSSGVREDEDKSLFGVSPSMSSDNNNMGAPMLPGPSGGGQLPSSSDGHGHFSMPSSSGSGDNDGMHGMMGERGDHNMSGMMGGGDNRVRDMSVMEFLPKLKQMCHSNDAETRLDGTRRVRKLLSKEEDPPALEVIQQRLVPVLVGFLSAHNQPKLQFEAAWALTNIASTVHTKVVVDNGAVGALASLMASPIADVREQSCWCLGNIAGDGATLRNIVLDTPNCLVNLLKNIDNPATESMLKNSTWALSNFCRGKPQPDIERIQPALRYLARLIQNTGNYIYIYMCVCVCVYACMYVGGVWLYVGCVCGVGGWDGWMST